MKTINYYEKIKEVPEVFTQLKCKELLFAHYNCPAKDRLLGKWSQNSYILYLVSGKLAYHTPGRSWLLTPDTAVFVKKGVGIMEKFFEDNPCIMTFFMPDSYLIAFMSENRFKIDSVGKGEANLDLVIPLPVTDMMRGYFNSIIPYFNSENIPSEDLLELKFRELLFNIITNPANKDLITYLHSLQLPYSDQLKQIMEANCLFNLSLQDYAKLCNRSLSSFKRDFLSVFKINPGEWLLAKRLNYSHDLLLGSDKPINDVCFESGFENTAHFSRAFKKRFGLSPLQYRNQAITSSLPLNTI